VTCPRPEIDRTDGWHELQVANPSFLVEKLGAECGDLQGLRELTVNGIEAIGALGAGQGGRIIWDLDWERAIGSDGRVRKLSVTDTGTGMTADQMYRYINQLAASSREQSRTGNFGVGAKVAAGSRNPHGLEYRSWHHGYGALVRFRRDRHGHWGLEAQKHPDGTSDYWRPLEEDDKPWALRGVEHGTQVVLLGTHESDDSTRAPASVTEGRRHWIARYLNSRFARLPDRIELLVREPGDGRDDPAPLQRIHGQCWHLEQRAQASGTLELSDATAHWWVLDEDHRGRRREAAAWISTGHAAAVLDDELYELLPQTRGGYNRLQDFGIRFGYERVVIYLQPTVQPGRLEANIARTLLLIHNEPLPWARWGEEFAAAMPAEILRLQEHAAVADSVPRQDAIRGRVTPLLGLYRLSRYRAPRDIDTHPSATPMPPTTASDPTTSPDPVTTADAQRDDDDMVAPSPRSVDLPHVAWISRRDGTRAVGDLEDQAARYHPARHELTINADFRAITDMKTYWRDRYRTIPGAQAVIDAQVTEWCEQILTEVVLVARSTTWTAEQFDALLSPAALTAALLPRHLLHGMLQKRLGQKLGAPRDTENTG